MRITSTPARFPLATLPTPLVPAFRLQRAIGGPLVWVKRDDLTGFATAGNKARSLEFLLGDAVAQGCDSLVTGGGAGSNFCAAAAAASQVANLACHLIFYGSPPEESPAGVHPNLAAAGAAGARIHFTGRTDRAEIDRAVPALAASLAARGGRPYALPRGGATAVGALGYAAAFGELAEQLDQQEVEPGAIVLATGSGGTLAGLLVGQAATAATPEATTARAAAAPEATMASASARARARAGSPPWRIIGATVSRPPNQIRSTVDTLASQCSQLLGGHRASTNPCTVVDARAPGFGLASDGGERARAIALATEGLLLDPVYTAKAFAVVLGLVADGYDRPIVFWHTGGLPAALQQMADNHLAANHLAANHLAANYLAANYLAANYLAANYLAADGCTTDRSTLCPTPP